MAGTPRGQKKSTKPRDRIKSFFAEESADTTDNAENEDTFQTPSTDENATDYQLDITSSHRQPIASSSRLDKGSQQKKQTSTTTRRPPRPKSKRQQSESDEESSEEESQTHNVQKKKQIPTRTSLPRSPKTKETSNTPRSPKSKAASKTHRSPSRPSTSRTENWASLKGRPTRTNSPQHSQRAIPANTVTQRRDALPTSSRGASRRKNPKPKKNLVLRDIVKLQQTTQLLIPKLPFSRVIRECLLNPDIGFEDIRIAKEALEALQEAAEIYLTMFFEDSYRCTLHRNRKTLIVKDMELVRFLRGLNDPGVYKN